MRGHMLPYVMTRMRRGLPSGGYRTEEKGKVSYLADRDCFMVVYGWCKYQPTQDGVGEFRILRCKDEDCWNHKKYPHEQLLMVEEEGLRRLAHKVHIRLQDIRL